MAVTIKIKNSGLGATSVANASAPAALAIGELAYSFSTATGGKALVIGTGATGVNEIIGGSAFFNNIGKTGTGFNVLDTGPTISNPAINVITGLGNINAVQNSGTIGAPYSLLINPGTGQYDKVKIAGALEVTGCVLFSGGANGLTLNATITFGSVASFTYADGIAFNGSSGSVANAFNVKAPAPVVAGVQTLFLPVLSTSIAASDTFATLAATQTFTNKTLTLPAISSISTNSGTATITLPTVTGTLATLAGTEALTNKTISASSLSGDITISTTTTKFLTNSPIFPVAGVRVYGVVDSFYGDIKYPALTASVVTTLPSHSVIFASTAAVTLTLPGNNLTFTTSAATTLTLPTSGTVVTKDSTDALTNKTFNTAATGNVFQINGTGITAVTGTAAVVLATSPTIATPTIAEIRGTGGSAALALYGNISADTAAVITLRSGLGAPAFTVNNTGVTAAGTLAVTGAVTFGSTLAVTSATTLSGTLTVTSGITVATSTSITTATSAGTIIIKPSSDGTIGTLTLTANAAVSGTLGVTGIATFTAVPVCTTAPTSDTQLANKLYVDSVAQGLHVHPPVRVATTANLTVTSYTWVTGTGTLTISALTVLDGITLAVNDRILVKDQTFPAYNGIYYYSSSTVLLRSLDANYIADLSGGDFVFVTEGTTLADCGFVQNSQSTTEFHTTTGPNITFVQFSQAGVVSAGAGLTKTGTTLDVVGVANSITVNTDSIEVASTYAGGTSITTVGTLDNGIINGGTF